MIFGNTASTVEGNKPAVSALLRLLKDESVIVRSWAISSLCIIGRRDKRRRRKILDAIGALQHDKSVAIRARTAEVLKVLRNEKVPCLRAGPRHDVKEVDSRNLSRCLSVGESSRSPLRKERQPNVFRCRQGIPF